MSGSAPAGLREDHASLGVALRAARNAQNLSVGEVARQLRLSVAQVEALETGAFERLPGPVFARGFIRNYARLLKLDADALLRVAPPAFAGEEAPSVVEQPQGTTLTVARGPRWGRYALGAVIIGLALAAYEFLPGEQEQVVPPRANESAKAEQALPAQAAVSTPAAPVAEGDAIKPGGRDNAETAGEKPLDPVRAEGVQDATPSAAGRGEIVLNFEGDSWIEIRERGGGVIFSQVSRRGTEHKITGTPPFVLVVGNANAVRLTYNERRVDLDRYSRNNVARLTLE